MTGWDLLKFLLPVLGLGLLAGGCLIQKKWGEQVRKDLIRPALGGTSVWPPFWMLIRNRSPAAIQSALGLRHPKPCSWNEGIWGAEKLFVSRPVQDWTLVVGTALPDPLEDADACFRFIITLSRKLGHVQLFCAQPALRHHAWVKASRGRILRAYAWAGKTLWNQGPLTTEEAALGIKCFAYAESSESVLESYPEAVERNLQKLTQLASYWSLDLANFEALLLERQCGVIGELSKAL